jgi:predicted nucleic acid-binding protein
VALIARYLIDTSAAARVQHSEVRARVLLVIETGLAATCAPLDADALFSARGPAEYENVRQERRESFEYLPMDDEHWSKAFDAQRELARTGRHRSVGTTDLLTAVLAGEHRLTLLHYNADFEIAADVVEFDQQWVVPRGTV